VLTASDPATLLSSCLGSKSWGMIKTCAYLSDLNTPPKSCVECPLRPAPFSEDDSNPEVVPVIVAPLSAAKHTVARGPTLANYSRSTSIGARSPNSDRLAFVQTNAGYLDLGGARLAACPVLGGGRYAY
jgi:hypothetical protein